MKIKQVMLEKAIKMNKNTALTAMKAGTLAECLQDPHTYMPKHTPHTHTHTHTQRYLYNTYQLTKENASADKPEDVVVEDVVVEDVVVEDVVVEDVVVEDVAVENMVVEEAY